VNFCGVGCYNLIRRFGLEYTVAMVSTRMSCCMDVGA
jgi:hypothetical protein